MQARRTSRATARAIADYLDEEEGDEELVEAVGRREMGDEELRGEDEEEVEDDMGGLALPLAVTASEVCAA